MPQVPMIDSPIKAAAMSGAKVQGSADLETFGGGAPAARAAQSVQNVGNAVMDIYEQEKKKNDNLQLTQAYADAVKAKNRLMWDPKSGAVNKQGRDASGVMDSYMPQFDSEMDVIEKSLGTEAQKQGFREIRIKQKLDFDGDLQRHMLKEHQTYEVETTKFALQAAQDDAVLNYQTPGKVGESLFLQKEKILEMARNQGHGPEWTEMALKTSSSQTHSGVLSRMISNGDDRMASAYFNSVKADMLGDDVSKMEKVLEESSMRGESQRVTDTLLTKHSTFYSALKEIKTIEDPKTRDAVMDRARTMFSFKEAEKKEFHDRMETGAYNLLDKSSGDLSSIPAQQWTQFTGAERSALKSYAEHKRSGMATKTDPETYYNLKTLSGDPSTRDEFQGLNLMRLRGKLSESDFKQFVDAQTDLKQGKTTTLDGFRSDLQIVTGTFAKTKTDTSTEAGKAKLVQFQERVEAAQVREIKRIGRPLSNEEMQKVADRELVEVVIPDSGWLGTSWGQTKKRKYELDPSVGRVEVDYKDIPPKEKSDIEAALQRAGQTPTQARVLELYTKGLSSGS